MNIDRTNDRTAFGKLLQSSILIHVFADPCTGKSTFVHDALCHYGYEPLMFDAGTLRKKSLFMGITQKSVGSKRSSIILDDLDSFHDSESELNPHALSALMGLFRAQVVIVSIGTIPAANYDRLNLLMSNAVEFELRPPTLQQMREFITAFILNIPSQTISNQNIDQILCGCGSNIVRCKQLCVIPALINNTIHVCDRTIPHPTCFKNDETEVDDENENVDLIQTQTQLLDRAVSNSRFIDSMCSRLRVTRKELIGYVNTRHLKFKDIEKQLSVRPSVSRSDIVRAKRILPQLNTKCES